MADVFEEKLKSFMEAMGIQGGHRVFSQSCHSVAEAAAAVGGSPEDLVKNVCLVEENSRFLVAIVKGEDRASTSRVAQALGVRKDPSYSSLPRSFSGPIRAELCGYENNPVE
jgi:Cys-tRNA(Pro)/Cys-tRNA(Cys) deacylase